MKITSMALAAAALATAGTAAAQSNVTLYGIMDAGIEYVNHAGANGGGAARLVSGGKNTSRWGLRGSEDLGGGLKGIFNLESGIAIDTGRLDTDNTLFDRRAVVGLAGSFGQVVFGRTFTTTYDFMLPYDPMGYAPNYSWATSSTATGDRKDGLFSRASNAVRYDGTFGGLKLGATVGFGEVAGNFKSSSKYDVGIGYSAGGFSAAATWDRQNGAGTSTTPADTTDYIQGIHAGASYDFGALKLFAGYRNYKRAFTTAAPRSAAICTGPAPATISRRRSRCSARSTSRTSRAAPMPTRSCSRCARNTPCPSAPRPTWPAATPRRGTART